MLLLWTLFWRFALISLLAFGGGQAALPLVERVAVAEMGWIGAADFAVAVGFGYATPGPVLITATFIGYHAAGVPGACAATLGAFFFPWLLAAAAARQLQTLLSRPWLRRFGRGAAAAVVGLLGATCLSLAKASLSGGPAAGIIIVMALLLSATTKLHPALLLVAGGALGAALL